MAMNDQSFDVFFISYFETEADANYAALLEHGITPIRIDGVTGIKAAHSMCATKSTSSHFFVIDADTKLLPDSAGKVFDFKIDFLPESKSVYVWRCKNAVNDLVYGYGAIKLFAVDCFAAVEPMSMDMTTSVADRYVIIHDLISETCFNTSPFESWKSGFREAVKLNSGAIKGSIPKENAQRLGEWTTKGADRPFGKYCIAGALAGVEYSRNNDLTVINDFATLRTMFIQCIVSNLTTRQLQTECARALLVAESAPGHSVSTFNKLAHHDSHKWYVSVISWYVDKYGELPSKIGPGVDIKLVMPDTPK